MKRVIWLAVLGAAVWGLPRLSHPAMDIGKLEPVETVLLETGESGIRIRTDSGATGWGKTLEDAIADLEQSTSSELFLDTTSKLMIAGELEPYWQEIQDTFRPSARICRVEGQVDLEEATEYLSVHQPKMTLNSLRVGENNWQILTIKEGRGQLVPE